MDYRVLFAAPLAALVMSVNAMELSLPSPWKDWHMGSLAQIDFTKIDYAKGLPEPYDIGMDPAAEEQGQRSLSIKSIGKLSPEATNFAVAQQVIQGYAGKRLRFSGQIRSEGVSTWAGLFMDDGIPNGTFITLAAGSEGGENTLPPSGAAGKAPYNTWQDVSVVVQVPATATFMTLGLALVGEGHVWAHKLRFEEVGPEVPLTSTRMLGFDWAKARDRRLHSEKMMSQMPTVPLANLSLD